MGPNERSPEISCRAGSAGSELVKEPRHQATAGMSERATRGSRFCWWTDAYHFHHRGISVSVLLVSPDRSEDSALVVLFDFMFARQQASPGGRLARSARGTRQGLATRHRCRRSRTRPVRHISTNSRCPLLYCQAHPSAYYQKPQHFFFGASWPNASRELRFDLFSLRPMSSMSRLNFSPL